MPIPTTNLRAKYDLNNPLSYSGTGNTLYDLTANNYDLTLTSTTYVEYDTFNALEFTAASPSTAVYDGSIGIPTGPPTFSFFIWIKTTSFTANAFDIFFSYGRDGNPTIGGIPLICSRAFSVNDVYSEFGSGKAPIAPGTDTIVNQWTNYCITSDGTTYKLYVNGALVGSAPLSGSDIWTLPKLTIGALQPAGSYPCNLEFNYLEAHSVALSDSDILTLYNETLIRFPVNSYDFSNSSCYPGTGNTVYDLVGSVDLPIVNATFGGTGQAKYFQFDGNADYIGKTSVSGLGDTFTANIWYQLDVVNSTGRQLWQVGVNSASGTNPGFYLNYPSTSDLNYGFSFGVGTTTATGVLSANTWQMATVTADGTTTKIYVDGVLAGSVAQGIGTWATGGFAIGAGVDGSGNISAGADGLLGKVAKLDIYNVALGSTEVSNLYVDTLPRFGGLTYSYDFSDPACYSGTGNTVFDLTGNNLDLPIVNATFSGTGQSKYFRFTGTNQYIGKTGVTGFGSTFTINMWARQNNNNTLYHSFNGGYVNNGPAMYWNDGAAGNIAPSFNSGNNKIVASGIATSEWYLTSYVLDGSTAKLYVDGSLIGSVAQAPGILWQNGVFVLAAAVDGAGNIEPAGYFVGDIAIFDVYNTALGSTAISDYYNNTSTRFGAAPPVYQGIVGGRQFAQGFNG